MLVLSSQEVTIMMSARSVNAFLGIWLVLSLVVWPHELAQRTNSLIVGGLVTSIAFVGVALPWARWINAALGAWLVASIWVLHTTRVDTFWNTLLVGAGIFVIAMLPNALPRHFLDVAKR
jgi:SPW repeat